MHVATLVTPDGAYGGPLRVALNQLAELQAMGHETLFVGGYRGYEDGPPTSMENVRMKLFPVMHPAKKFGFATMFSIPMLRWIWTHASNYDIVHIHLARDMITMPVARMLTSLKIPYVVQSHGMIDESNKILAKALDLALTRSALHHAQSVAYLTPEEKRSLAGVFGLGGSLVNLPNGVPRASVQNIQPAKRQVLFLARMHSRKRPTAFVEAALELHEHFPEVTFALVGPDEGEAAEVSTMIQNGTTGAWLNWEGALDPGLTLSRMRGATIYVLPAVDEPFPMSVLEALSLGIPVVITDTCGLAPFVEGAGAGIVTDGSVQDLVEAIKLLLTDDTARRGMAKSALDLARSTFEMGAVAVRLESLYVSASGKS
ncbi:glycosyltransferase [Agreia sp. PsM10]|uniref:glycosyltransferase n=1 Tax=Agreia sp. PsM10 TaxID=3030533 RepID=UPI00263B8AA3|nr:glycosyltransferase [Agreia sp. PsM10]MDN4641334.1 glycosyltransferase [Agreia sp. PsM10]